MTRRDVERIILDSRNVVRAKLKRTDYHVRRKVVWKTRQGLRGYRALSLLGRGKVEGLRGVAKEQRDGA